MEQEMLRLVRPDRKWEDAYLDFQREWKESGEISMPALLNHKDGGFGGLVTRLEGAEVGLLMQMGGHIGYAIRPSERRKGYAGRMLALGLQEARKLALDRVLVTCDADK